MTVKNTKLTRRQVLLGVGGATLALPILPSLMTRTAFGQDPATPRARRLFWLTTDHGAAFETAMFPSTSLLSPAGSIFSDHAYKAGALVSAVNGDTRVLSPVLSASASRFTETLQSKMNALYGLDVPFYINHNTGLHMGNYARNNGGGDGGGLDPRPTIDQILAWSESFYPDLNGIKERSMILGGRPISWNYSSPATQSGTIENVRGSTSSRDMFNRIFVAPAEVDDETRKPVVDKVRESYSMLRNGNARLSMADKRRLDDHMDRIAELERRLTTVASCGNVTMPTDDAEQHWKNDPAEVKLYCELMVDVVVAAFTCGTSRIAALGLDETSKFVAYSGDWHQNVAHQWSREESQALIVSSYQRVFEWCFLDLAAKLDVEEADGSTYLDNTLMAWSQESGMETHGSVSVPIITFGSAANFLKTGQFLDYRRTEDPKSKFGTNGGDQYTGVLYSQWLATVLQSMGLAPSEFERWGHKGYGVPYIGTETWLPPYAYHYQNTESRYFETSSDLLPGIKA
jgi:hypothetical protein